MEAIVIDHAGFVVRWFPIQIQIWIQVQVLVLVRAQVQVRRKKRWDEWMGVSSVL